MSTLSGILILLLFIFGATTIFCLPIKDGNISIVSLVITGVCALLLLVESCCSDIEVQYVDDIRYSSRFPKPKYLE